jgi:lipopolysaccharide/colanic/teichoic acid biosynthesis glycosyltransferase
MSAFIGAILSPILLLIAIAVKLTSEGPVFHKWRVVGKSGRFFTGYKFRSMYRNAEQLKGKLLDQNEMIGPVFKLNDDPRITPLGRFLRKYSLDELPQLWSVIKGDMSLVGPRPPLQSEYHKFTDWQRQKLSVKPGITCLWQIKGRNEISDFNDWVKLDLEYIQRRTFWLDVKILLGTAKVVIKGTGR